MNELHFGGRVRELLDRRLEDIDADRLARLRQARERALLARRRSAVTGIGHALLLSAHAGTPRARLAVAACTLLLAAWLAAWWHVGGPLDEAGEVETALLIDDLPVEALLDSGFQSWLASR